MTVSHVVKNVIYIRFIYNPYAYLFLSILLLNTIYFKTCNLADMIKPNFKYKCEQ